MGSVVFASSGEKVEDIIKLVSSYEWSFKDTKFVRKMLEITTEERRLFVQAKEEHYRIEGLGLKNEADLKKQKVYICFWGYFSYLVFSMGEEILRCENGIYHPTKEDVELNVDAICTKYRNIPGLRGILQKWDKIEHGAIYIFAEDA